MRFSKFLLLISIFYLYPSLNLSAQANESVNQETASTENSEPIHCFVNDRIYPKYKHGTNEALPQLIIDQLIYPTHQCIQGTTILSFKIDINGNVKNPEIKRSISEDIDKQLLKIILNYQFIPGYQHGKAVETRMVMPFKHGQK